MDQVTAGDGDVLGRERRDRRPLRAAAVPVGARARRRSEVHVVTMEQVTGMKRSLIEVEISN